jgi:SAM-dependent methyltransferase
MTLGHRFADRRMSFGSVAERYDAVRPAYPVAAVDAVLEYAGLGRGARALEIGAGTGQATAQFAERGLEVLALEPSPDMAAVARRRFKGTHPSVTVVEAEFERAELPARTFDLVFAATSWHWLSESVRWARTAAALRPGGTVAALWNWPLWRRSPLREEFDRLYRGYGASPATIGPLLEVEPGGKALRDDWLLDAPQPAAFEDVRWSEHHWRAAYTAGEYGALLGTYADHIALNDATNNELMEAITSVIDRHGGSLELEYVTVLLLARRIG